MAHKEQQYSSQVVLHAVETLSSIAELQIDASVTLTEEQGISLAGMPVFSRAVHWLHRKNAEKVMLVVREKFKIILGYLRQFYKKEYGQLTEHSSVEGVKTMMVLVGEAAKKVDRYSRLFVGQDVGSVKDFKEYKALWNFYSKKIAPIVVQESLTQWIQTLPIKAVLDASKEHQALPESTNDHFLDLDTINKDIDYELLFIRKQNGNRFFHTRLLRNMKLVSNFEEYFGGQARENINFEILRCEDIQLQSIAETMIRKNWHLIDQFLKGAVYEKEDECVHNLYSALIALMFASHQTPGLSFPGHKGIHRYVHDFLRFLRRALISSGYHKATTCSETDVEKKVSVAVKLIKKLLYTFYFECPFVKGIEEIIDDVGHYNIEPKRTSREMNGIDRLGKTYQFLLGGVQHFLYAPLLKNIDILEEGAFGYDPHLMYNLPTQLFDLQLRDQSVRFVRFPAPVYQESIDKAHVYDEFRTVLYECAEEHRHLLMINFQNRSNWKELARCHCLEALQKREEFQTVLDFVSLPKSGDWYNQAGVYQRMDNADDFIEHLVIEVQNQKTGYFYSHSVLKRLPKQMYEELAIAIHRLFFSGKGGLLHAQRLDFIELYHLLLIMKIVVLTKTEICALSCKDGLDDTLSVAAELLLFLQCFNDRSTIADEKQLEKILFVLPLILRGRLLLSKRFLRMRSAMQTVMKAIAHEGDEAFRDQVRSLIDPIFGKGFLESIYTSHIPHLGSYAPPQGQLSF